MGFEILLGHQVPFSLLGHIKLKHTGTRIRATLAVRGWRESGLEVVPRKISEITPDGLKQKSVLDNPFSIYNENILYNDLARSLLRPMETSKCSRRDTFFTFIFLP